MLKTLVGRKISLKVALQIRDFFDIENFSGQEECTIDTLIESSYFSSEVSQDTRVLSSCGVRGGNHTSFEMLCAKC